jgi:hypothetical protein
VRQAISVTVRMVVRTLGQHRSAQRKMRCGLHEEERLTEEIIELAKELQNPFDASVLRFARARLAGSPV